MPRAVAFNPLLRRAFNHGDTPPPHPGEILREDFLHCAAPALEQAIRDLSDRLDWSADKLTAVIHEQHDITPDLAWRLGEFFGTSARYWLALQLQYDLWHDEPAPAAGHTISIDCAY